MGGSASKNTVGIQVLQVTPGSPADLAGLRPFWDWIVAGPGIVFDRDGPEFMQLIRTSVDKEVPLTVYNVRSETLRECVVVPGAGGVAGLSVRFASFAHATECVWRVTGVRPGGPAAAAGIRGDGVDFIVGSPEVVFGDADDLFLLVASSVGSPLPLVVYAADSDTLRTVTITPAQSKDGPGLLGCDVATGALHRLPPPPPPSPQQQQQL